MKIVGLVGEKAAGKETFSGVIKELSPDTRHFRFSDILLDIADQLRIPKKEIKRRQLQELAKELDRIFGAGTITRAMQSRIQKASASIIILDGIRWLTDVQMLRSLPNNCLVYITADVQRRYEWAKRRKEKAGEAAMSFEQFLKEEQAETEKYIPEIGAAADYRIENNGTLDDFKRRAELFYIFKT